MTTYALAALRSGAPAAEIAYAFLEDAEAVAVRRFAADDAPGLEAELRTAIDAIRAGRFPARPGPALPRVPGARPALRRARAGVGGVRRSAARRAAEILDRLAAEHPDASIALHWSTPLELLVATILSAQSTDVGVNRVTETLFRRFRTPEDYLARAGRRPRAADQADRVLPPEDGRDPRLLRGHPRAARRRGAARRRPSS